MFLEWNYEAPAPNIVFNVYHRLSITEPWSLYYGDVAEHYVWVDFNFKEEYFTVTAFNTVSKLESDYAQ